MTASCAATQMSIGQVTGCIAGGRSGWNDARDLLAREMIRCLPQPRCRADDGQPRPNDSGLVLINALRGRWQPLNPKSLDSRLWRFAHSCVSPSRHSPSNLAAYLFRPRATASLASLSAVRRRSVSRLSQSCLPLARASSTFTLPFLK